MNSVNAVQLLILVWSFLVCQAFCDDFSVSCDDVTGTVGNEVTFTCNISEQCSEFCIKYYNFKYPEIYNKSIICEKVFPECEQRCSFTCRYTPTSGMKGTFRFHIQTTCGIKTAEFTVEISEPVKPSPGIDITDKPSEHPDVNAKKSIAVVVSGVIIIIIIIIIIILTLVIICKEHSARFHKSMFQCIPQNEGDSRTESGV